MEIRQIQYFIAVAEQLSFSKAASVLYVTQPLLSQQIAELEYQLGSDLFIRNKRSVSLTPAGQVFYQGCKGILEQINQTMLEVRKSTEKVGESGELSVGFEYVYPRKSVTDAISSFRLEYPNADVRVEKMNATKLFRKLGSGEMDIGFFTFPFPGIDEEYEIIRLEQTPLVIAVSQVLQHTGSGAEFIRYAERYPLYQMGDDTRGLAGTLKICEEIGIHPTFGFVKDMEELLTYVESGMGFAILAENIMRSYGSDHLLSLEIEQCSSTTVCNCMVWLKSNPNPLIQKIRPFAGESCGSCEGECGKHCPLNPGKVKKEKTII